MMRESGRTVQLLSAVRGGIRGAAILLWIALLTCTTARAQPAATGAVNAATDGSTLAVRTERAAVVHERFGEAGARDRPRDERTAEEAGAVVHERTVEEVGAVVHKRPPAARNRLSAYHARRDSLIDFYDSHDGRGYMQAAARLYRGEDLEWVQSTLDTLMQHPTGDMFWMYPNVLIHYLGREHLPQSYMQRLREQWREYTPYRGDTENHWAMYYASLYLMAQLYPDEPGEAWFNGRSSEENLAEARDYLISWMDLTTSRGQGEYDSPHYMAYFLIPMAELYVFAEDPAMRQRARMMIDYISADFAVESLEGLYVGGFSRIYPGPLVQRWDDHSTSFAWMMFGNTPFRPSGAAFVLALSGYVPPAEIYHIARDRSEPYVHRELKRTRHRIRYSDVRNAPIYKYLYMSDDYGMASTQGGLLQPIQQHTWEILWAADDPKEGYNMLFTLHPYSSPHELAMYFPEEPELLIEAVVKSKGTYDSPDKWTGASPYEEVFQHGQALIVLYDIPPGTRFPFISGFFPKTLARRDVHGSGWIFSRGGDAYIAYYPLAPYEWQEEDDVWRLHSSALKNGAVVQTARASEYDSFAAFRDAVLALPLETSTEPTPRVEFTSLSGDRMSHTHGETPRINGDHVGYDDWPLFDGPFMHAEKGSRRLELTYGQMQRILDFDTLTITDRIRQP